MEMLVDKIMVTEMATKSNVADGPFVVLRFSVFYTLVLVGLFRDVLMLYRHAVE